MTVKERGAGRPTARRVACVVVVLLTMAWPLSGTAREDVPAEIAARKNPVVELSLRQHRYLGRQFKGKCARCHGHDGSGGGADAAEQRVVPADFTDTAYMSTRTDGQLYYQILMGGGERCAMPAFGPESDHGWAEEKIWRMVAFVRQFASKPGPGTESRTSPE